jgi:hypothetical protein
VNLNDLGFWLGICQDVLSLEPNFKETWQTLLLLLCRQLDRLGPKLWEALAVAISYFKRTKHKDLNRNEFLNEFGLRMVVLGCVGKDLWTLVIRRWFSIVVVRSTFFMTTNKWRIKSF